MCTTYISSNSIGVRLACILHLFCAAEDSISLFFLILIFEDYDTLLTIFTVDFIDFRLFYCFTRVYQLVIKLSNYIKCPHIRTESIPLSMALQEMFILYIFNFDNYHHWIISPRLHRFVSLSQTKFNVINHILLALAFYQCLYIINYFIYIYLFKVVKIQFCLYKR